MRKTKTNGIIKEVEIEPDNKQILKGIKQAVEEMKLVKAGKLKPRPLKELLDEI